MKEEDGPNGYAMAGHAELQENPSGWKQLKSRSSGKSNLHDKGGILAENLVSVKKTNEEMLDKNSEKSMILD